MKPTRELSEKILSEKSLSWAESAELDELLEKSEVVKPLVAGLPSEPLSMEWRSSLNAKLAQHQPKPRKRLLLPWVGGFAASAAAIAIAAFIFQPKPVPTAPTISASPDSSLELALVQAHSEEDFEAESSEM